MDARRFGCLLALTALAAITSTPAVAQPRRGVADHPLLQRAIEAQDRLRFSGVRRVQLRFGTEPQESTERVWFDAGRLRIETEGTGEDSGQVIVVAGGQRRHFFPRSNEIHVRPSGRDEVSLRLSEFAAGRGGRREVREAPGGTVAGLPTVLLEFMDRNQNPVARLWINPQSAMVLRRELLNPGGRRVAFMEYVSVDMSPNFGPDDFTLERRGARVLTLEDQVQALARQAGVPVYRLPGDRFILDMVRAVPIHPAGGPRRVALAQTYRAPNGRRVTLFVLRGDADPARLMRSGGEGLGSVIRRDGPVTLVLIGGFPPEDLRAMLRRVQRTS